MSGEVLLAGLLAVLLGTVHVLSPYLAVLDRTPRSVWLSLAGGVSVAYVFVHLLPELALEGAALEGSALAHEEGLFTVALAGLVVFYGLERLARERAARHERARAPFRLHLAAFALYNFLIGYLIEAEAAAGPAGLALYGLAMGLHFTVNDRALFAHHGQAWLDRGRWVLAASAPAGWALSLLVAIPEFWTALLFALLAGAIVLNVIKEELPAERASRFWAFALGAAGYGAILIVS